jgi:hypothetical protein
MNTKVTAATADLAVVKETWAIDANSLKCVDQQETNLSGDDEVYVVSLAFRTTPGKAGSTSVWFHGNLTDINSVSTGETKAIPNTMGRVSFPNVVRRSLADILAGNNPELIGTLTLPVESDLTPNNEVNNLFTEAAVDARPILANAIEPLSLADITNGQALAARLADIGDQVKDAVKPTFGEKLLLFFSSFFDADDPITDGKLNLFVAVDDTLAGLVDQQLGPAIPATVGVGGALRARTYTQRFADRGAIYDINFSVTR